MWNAAAEPGADSLLSGSRLTNWLIVLGASAVLRAATSNDDDYSVAFHHHAKLVGSENKWINERINHLHRNLHYVYITAQTVPASFYAALRVYDNRTKWRVQRQSHKSAAPPPLSPFLLGALTKTFHCERPMVGLINSNCFPIWSKPKWESNGPSAAAAAGWRLTLFIR